VIKTVRPGEDVVILTTRPGVTVRLFVVSPASSGAVKGVFLLLPGGEGKARGFDGRPHGHMGRVFVHDGFVAAVVDAPSDRPDGLGGWGDHYSDRFRIGPEHTQDAQAIIDFLGKRWPAPFYLLGHSMGAISVAHLAASLAEPRLAGVVMTGSPTLRGPQGAWISVPSVPLRTIKVPVLLVHHRDDGCRGSTFAGASRYPKLFTASPRVGFLEVGGGDATPGEDPCRGGYHYFPGKTREVAEAILAWIARRSVPERIGP
jgi:pimeloyl-ACP methyl ester carboxylesterase